MPSNTSQPSTSLSGHRVVVIGGSSGMGLATAVAAAAAGAFVTIASSSRERLDAALAQLPDTCDGIVADIRNEAEVAALFDQVGDLDHLVVTAGDAPDKRRLTDLPLEDARAQFEVRLWGAVSAVKHAAAHFRPGGSISLTSGTLGVRPAPGGVLAASAAGAVEALARGLAVELAPIRVNTVRAGATRTPLWDRIPEAQREEILAGLAEHTLTGSVGEAEQIAASHLYLMQNSFVSGTVLTVDGGSVLTG